MKTFICTVTITLLLNLAKIVDGSSSESRKSKPFGVKSHSITEATSTSDFDLAQEAVFHAVEQVETALIDAIRDEVETIFHPLPKHHHHTQEVHSKHEKVSKHESPESKSSRQTMWDGIQNGWGLE